MSKRLIRVQSLLVEIESTEGTDPTPATANAVRPAGPLTLELGAEVVNMRDDVITEVLSKLGPLPPAAKFARLTIPWHVRGFGSAYSASNLPEADALFRACAMSQTVVTTGGSESVTYELRSTGQESCAIYFYVDGKRHILLGCRGTWSANLEAGHPGVITFVVTGVYANAASDQSLVAGTYQSTVPPLYRSSSVGLVYNSVSALIARRYGCDIGNTVTARLNANAADALAGFHVTDRNPEASFVVEDPLVATADFEGDWIAATQRVLDAQLGATQYNRCKFHHDRFTPNQPAYSQEAGLQLATVSGRIGNEGSEDVALVFD